MSDIVERLRDKWQHSEEGCYEAADEIERLRDECQKQAQLNGMGSEREAALFARTFDLKARINLLEEALRNAQVELREIGHNAADPFESDEDYTENFPAIAERAFSAASAIDAALEKRDK